MSRPSDDAELPPEGLARLLHDAQPLLDEFQETPVIGRYRILRELGRGGMGVVYAAEDRELGRRVALKVLRDLPGGSDVARERFRREAQAAARLNHPHIAAVYEATEDTIAMQLVEGPPLSRWTPSRWSDGVRMVRDAALAVEHAHRRGVIHRDLKPHNLLVEGERVLVTDFGLAKESARASSLSLPGHVLGTPAYMAPEQARGAQDEVDVRTDVYGLGATLYDLLAGRPPFVGDSVISVLREVLHDEPPSLRSLRPNIPRDLARIVHQCLEKNPARRYGSAEELAEDLTRWLEGRPVIARGAPLWYRAVKSARRHRVAVLLTLAVLVATVASVSLWMMQRTASASAAALELARRVEATLADVESLHAASGDREGLYRRLDREISACRTFLKEHRTASAWLLQTRLLAARGQREEAVTSVTNCLREDPTLDEARVERGLLLAELLTTDLAKGNPPIAPHEVGRLSSAALERRGQALDDLSCVPHCRHALRESHARYAEAEAHRLAGRFAESEAAYRDVLRMTRGTHLGANEGLSRLELARGNDDAAWGHAMNAVDLYRGLAPAYAARHDLPGPVERAVRQHQLEAAHQRVLGEDRSPSAFEERALARIQLQDVEGTLADLGKVLDSDPTNAGAHAHRALVRARQGAELANQGALIDSLDAWSAAIEDGKRAMTLDPLLVGALNNRGVAFLERHRLHLLLGHPRDAQKDLATADSDLLQAVSTAPAFTIAWQNRALLARRIAEDHVANERWSEALTAIGLARSHLNRVLEIVPEDSPAHLERALGHALAARIFATRGASVFAAKAQDAARADHAHAARTDPGNARARGLYGLFLLEVGHVKEAHSELRAALSLNPDPRHQRRFEDTLAR